MTKEQNAFSARQHYRELSKSDNPVVRVGRNEDQAAKEADVWKDICSKMDFKQGGAILDIGCGSGIMASNIIKLAAENQTELHLMDDPQVISRLAVPQNVHVHGGYFLEEYQPGSFDRRFDRILAYSVLHIVNRPWEFVFKLASMLGEGGRLLIGDIANQSLRARMMTSVEGSNFHRSYRGESASSEPIFRTTSEYYAGAGLLEAEANLDDAFMAYIILRLRGLGYNGYWLPQPRALPFSLTREDLLICRPAYK